VSEPVRRAQIIVAEKSRSLAGLLVGFLEEANYTVAVATTEEEALSLVQLHQPELVLSTVSRFDGEAFCKQLRKQHRLLPVALIYPPSRTDDVEARARMFGADLCLVGPVQKAAVISAARLLIRLGRSANVRPEPPPEADDESLEPLDLPTFKRMLNLEVRKSRRYHFPAAFLLVELDSAPFKARSLDRTERVRLLGGALGVLVRSLRDIDLCVHTGHGRFIVFLPHTPRAGAQVVAARLHERLQRLTEPRLLSSIGVAAYDGQGSVSFGSLLRDATLALKRASSEGGDRVVLADAKKRERVFIA
jgi:PleD family two-component response regulator